MSQRSPNASDGQVQARALAAEGRAPAIVAQGLVKTFAAEQRHPTAYVELHQLVAARRRQFTALDAVSLQVQPGERVAVIGNNGAGKSTLLKILAGLHRPTAGRLVVLGSRTLLSGLGIGMVDELSVVDNVDLYGAIYGIDRATTRARMAEILDWAELRDFERAKVKHLSSGMKARLAFSVLRHVDKDIYLLDEVLTAGDKNFRERCKEVLLEYQRTGKTVVAATHDRSCAETFCTKALWLHHGRVIAFGEAAVVLNAYYRTSAG